MKVIMAICVYKVELNICIHNNPTLSVMVLNSITHKSRSLYVLCRGPCIPPPVLQQEVDVQDNYTCLHDTRIVQ